MSISTWRLSFKFGWRIHSSAESHVGYLTFFFHGHSKLCSPHPRECCFFAGHLEGGIGVRLFIQPLLLRTECASTASAWKCSRVFSGFLASTAHSSDGECPSWQNSRQSILTGIHPVCPNYPFLCTMLAYTKSHSFPFVVLSCIVFIGFFGFCTILEQKILSTSAPSGRTVALGNEDDSHGQLT
jgi:hypothetical protein